MFANKADFPDQEAKAVKWLEEGIAEQILWLESKKKNGVAVVQQSNEMASRIDVNIVFGDMDTKINRNTDESYQLRYKVDKKILFVLYLMIFFFIPQHFF